MSNYGHNIVTTHFKLFIGTTYLHNCFIQKSELFLFENTINNKLIKYITRYLLYKIKSLFLSRINSETTLLIQSSCNFRF